MNSILILVWMHWFSDFITQTDAMAKNKSKSMKWLSLHIAVYTIPFLIFGWKFAVFNGLAHWVVDFFTSRWTSKLWAKGQVHNFFVVIGFDQAIHLTTLFLSYEYFK